MGEITISERYFVLFLDSVSTNMGTHYWRALYLYYVVQGYSEVYFGSGQGILVKILSGISVFCEAQEFPLKSWPCNGFTEVIFQTSEPSTGLRHSPTLYLGSDLKHEVRDKRMAASSRIFLIRDTLLNRSRFVQRSLRFPV